VRTLESLAKLCALVCSSSTACLQVIGIQPQSPLSWSADGQRLAYVSSNFDICVLRAQSGTQFLPFAIETLLTGHGGLVRSLSFHPRDPSVLVSTGVDGICLWHIDSGRLITRKMQQREGTTHEADVMCCTWSFDGATLIVGRFVVLRI
jgi:WD40 repeat protein